MLEFSRSANLDIYRALLVFAGGASRIILHQVLSTFPGISISIIYLVFYAVYIIEVTLQLLLYLTKL